ncbi:MAG: adenylyl-sulfate kinase, partial [Gammaproteobacteria bacterium]
NKMDLVDYRESVYEKIRADYQEFAARLDIPDLHFIPISALLGDNVVDPTEKMKWYQGRTLMSFLESVYIGSDRNLEDFRLPVQYVNRPDLDFRGYCGTISSGTIRKGEEVLVLPSRKSSKVKEIVTYDGSLEEAVAPSAITLTLEDEIDISRGDIIVRPGNLTRLNDRFQAMIVWMDEDAMVPGKTYVFKHTSNTVTGSISTLRYVVDVNTLHRGDAPTLKLNEIGRCTVKLTEPIAYDGYRRNRATGAFIIIDRITNVTVGAGMIQDRAAETDRRDHWDDSPCEESLHRELSNVSLEERSARFGQQPVTLLLTGLTGAGKTTLSYALERRLFDQGRACTVLDGQNMRLGINRDLGFSAEDRSENLRRAVELAKLLNNAGMICIAGLIAPDAAIRERATAALGNDRCLVVHLSAPVEVCRQRDTQGHYARADAGEIANFPGVSTPYEAPENPDLVLETHELSIDACVDQLVKLLESNEFI